MPDPELRAFAAHARIMASARPGTPVKAVWPDSRGREEIRPLPELTADERETWARLADEASSR